MQVTVCGKIKDISMYPALDGTAELMARVERLYFRERYVKRGEPNELKRTFLKKHGITGRQLNGVIFSLAGEVDATRKCLQRNLDTKERKVYVSPSIQQRMGFYYRKNRSKGLRTVNNSVRQFAFTCNNIEYIG